MKQKRKVKSLLSQRKDLNGGFMTALLLALGLALCLGSATLMTTSSVGAAGVGQTISNIPYSGLDDKVEVLYNLQFSQPNNLSGIVGEMYTDRNNDFYITSTPLIVNLSDTGTHENKVRSGVYSNILGGIDNVVNSKNITIIGGERNKIAESNDNAVILGGIGNEIRGTSSGVPSVIIGGENNILHGGQNGDAIIGGKSNTIGSNVSNSFILGGSGNTINTNNAIVGGTNVTVNTGDVFVFSNDGAFEPQTPKTFYLNLEGGLGINTGSAGKGVTVNGPVKFGEINIKEPSKYPCDSNHLGMVGVWIVGSTGCLVGCTSSSAGDIGPSGHGKWDLLDRGEICQELCDDSIAGNSDYCSQKKPEVPEINIHYNSFCTTGMNGITNTIVDVSNASPCTPVWDQIENVVYETSLIDAADVNQCPANAANKCIYQCNSGYHLTGDTTMFPGRISVEKCYKDCNLVELLGNDTWKDSDGNPIILKHNQTITGYNKNEVPCSYDSYVRAHAGINAPNYNRGDYLDNGYGTKYRRNSNGIGLDFTNSPYWYELPETCTNNAHQQVLVCVNGQMYIATGIVTTNVLAISGGTLGDNYLGYAHNGYIYKSCHTTGYQCNISQYDLTESYINTGLYDTGMVKNPTNPKDRNTVQGTRGIYKLCLDYKVDTSGMGCEVNVTKTGGYNNALYDMHYEFKGCRTGSGYRPTERTGGNTRYTGTPKDDSRVCRKECRFKPIDMTSDIVKRDLYELTLYNVSSGSCIAVDDNSLKHCESITVKCDDGVWKDATGNTVTNARLHENYGYSKCLQNGNPCTGYNVSRTTYSERQNIEPGLYGSVISDYTPECHRMHARNSPYPAASDGGPWNRRYRDNVGSQVRDFGNPNPIQRECEDNQYRRKLRNCLNKCYHANDLSDMQYCIKDIKFEAMCPDKGNTIRAGRVYNVWEGEWNAGSYATGNCDYYCPNGKYKYLATECRDNPVCEEPTDFDHDTLFRDTTDRVRITGGYKNYYILRNKSNGAIVRTAAVACIDCDDDNPFVGNYHQEGNSCVSNSLACQGNLPKHASHGSSSTYNGERKAWTHTDGNLGDCLFTCKTGYEWDGYACVETACASGYNLCTITYDAGTGESSIPSETVICGTKIQLATATLKCNNLDYWYRGSTSNIIGTGGGYFTLNTNMKVDAKWSEVNIGECAPKCNGGERPSGGHIIINDDPGDDPNRPWQFVSGYSGTDFTSLGTCQWACERGYMRGAGALSGTCVEKPCGTDSSHVRPTGSTVRYLKSTYVGLDGVKWTYTGTTVGNATQPDNNTPNFDTTQNKEKCLWTCKAGYTHSGSTCVKRTCYTNSNANNRSSTLVPTIAYSEQGTGLFYIVDNLYWTGVKSNPGACQWACESGYTRLKRNGTCQNTCVPIHDGKCMSNGSRRVGNSNASGYCYTGTHGTINTTSYANKYTWDCISNNVGNVCYSDKVGTNQESCYRCKPGYTGSSCIEIRNASCNNDVELGCKYTGVTAQTSDTSGKVDYQDDTTIYWHCEGKNGGAEANGCKKCKSGYSRNGSACVKCQGTMPSEASLNTTTLPNNNTTYYTCNPSSTAACTYTCPMGQTCDGTSGCRDIDNGSCDTSEPYGCENTSNRVEKTDTTSDNQWKRYCRGLDGKSSLCTKSCEDGETLEWTSEHNGTCESPCPAPTITEIKKSDKGVYFDLNGAISNTVMLLYSEDQSNWTNIVSNSTSPRTLPSTAPNKGYVKLRTICSNGKYSEDSNVVAYDFSPETTFPEMIIDSIKNCKMTYHFNGTNPLEGKTCCTAARLERAYSEDGFSGPLTTNYSSPITVTSEGKEGMIYFRYKLNGEYSPVYSYNMSKQTGCGGGSNTCSKVDWNGNPFNRTPGNIYDENHNKYELNSYKIYNASYWQGSNQWTYIAGGEYTVDHVTTVGLMTSECARPGYNPTIYPSCTQIIYYPAFTLNGYVPSADNNWSYVKMSNGEVYEKDSHIAVSCL